MSEQKMAVVETKTETRSLEDPNVPLGEAMEVFDWGSESDSGVRVNSNTILTHHGLFRGVNLITSNVAKIPLHVMKRDDEGELKAKEHPAYYLLKRRPNPEMSAIDFRQTLLSHGILWGNGYAWIERRGPRPVNIWPLLPDKTYPIRVNGQLWYVVESESGKQDFIHPDDIIHIKGLGYNGLVGHSIIKLAANSIGLALAHEKFSNKYFKNSATPNLVIQVPGSLSDKAFKHLKESWQSNRAGLDQSHKPAILEEGAAINSMSFSAADSQLVESKQLDLVTVANWLGLPPHKVGGEGRTAYASLEQENQATLDDCYDPWMVKLEQEFEEKLLSTDEKKNETHFIEHKRQALVRADLAQRSGHYRTALAGQAWMTVNEIRKLENLNPIDGGDELMMPLNMQNPNNTFGDTADTPDDEPQDEPETDENADQLSRYRPVLEDAVRRILERIKVHAVKNAKDYRKFPEWVDQIEELNGEYAQKCLEPWETVTGRNADLGDFWENSKRNLNMLMDKTPVKELEYEVQRIMVRSLNQVPAKIAEQIERSSNDS